MFDFKSAEISEDGETFIPIMAPPGQISIECDQSDTGRWTTNCVRPSDSDHKVYRQYAEQESIALEQILRIVYFLIAPVWDY